MKKIVVPYSSISVRNCGVLSRIMMRNGTIDTKENCMGAWLPSSSTRLSFWVTDYKCGQIQPMHVGRLEIERSTPCYTGELHATANGS
jgi:hypothetical protein